MSARHLTHLHACHGTIYISNAFNTYPIPHLFPTYNFTAFFYFLHTAVFLTQIYCQIIVCSVSKFPLKCL